MHERHCGDKGLQPNGPGNESRRCTLKRRARRGKRPAFEFSRLEKPDPQFDLRHQLKRELNHKGRAAAPFETRSSARREDRLRAETLSRTTNSSLKTQRLQARLDRNARGGMRKTFASSAFMRELRRRLCGAFLELIDRERHQNVWLYTVVPEWWRIPGADLRKTKTKNLLQQFRSQLNRRGLAQLEGWMVVAIHGDYDPVSDIFNIHLHIICAGDKAKAIEELRGTRLYQPTGFVARPIVRQRLQHAPRQVSYFVCQPFWPAKFRAENRSPGRRTRIPAERLSEWLIWMDQQTFTDLIWLHNCEIKNGRLVSCR